MLKYILSIPLALIGYKYMQLKDLTHFELSEFRGEWPFLDTKVLLSLDYFRALVGVPVTIQPSDGAMIRFKANYEGAGVPHSQHFEGKAIDVRVHLKTVNSVAVQNAIDSAIKAGFGGVGVYPDHGDGSYLSMHLDTRVVLRHVATWGQVSGLMIAQTDAVKLYG